MEKLTELTLTQTREALVRGRVSARELTQAWPVSYTHLTLPTT